MCATPSMREIWYESPGFNRYRGTGWMKEPCQSCDDKEKDLAAAAARPTCSQGRQQFTPNA
jgi:MoaA/NifB/PqqE/SkfB family radical SAM enzyme